MKIRVGATAWMGAVFVAWLLGAGIIPNVLQGAGGVAAWAGAAAGGVLYVGLILGHELAHVAVGRRLGREPVEVVVGALGGYTQFKQEPKRPRELVWVAVSGPAASLVLGGLVGAVGVGLNLAADGRVLPVVLVWVGALSILTGVFNLLPIVPLDGGVALEGVLWAVMRSKHRQDPVEAFSAAETVSLPKSSKKDLDRATTKACTVGQAGSLVGIMIGAGMVAAGGLIGVIVVIGGIILYRGSSQEKRYARIRSALEGVEVEQVMRPMPQEVGYDTTVESLKNRVEKRWAVYSVGGGIDKVVDVRDLKHLSSKALVRDSGWDVERQVSKKDRILDVLENYKGGALMVWDGENKKHTGLILPYDIVDVVEERHRRNGDAEDAAETPETF